VVIHDLDVVDVALAEIETDKPTIIVRQRPLLPLITSGLVQRNTFQRTEIAERSCPTRQMFQ